MSIGNHIGIKTYFKAYLHKAMLDENGEGMLDEDGCPMVVPGTRRLALDWFPNTFLIQGMEEIARRTNWSQYLQVGTSGVAPIPTDTSLGSWIAGTATIVSNTDVSGSSSLPPWYGWRRRTFRFPVGDTAANLNEVALGWDAGPSGNISIRALLVDPSGVPTTIVPQATEILDVLAEIRYYSMLGDVEGSVTLDGVLYDTITRASMANSAPQYRSIGEQMQRSTAVDSFDYAAYAGELGTVLQTPTGDYDNSGSVEADLTYGANNYFRDIQVDVNAAGWVLPLAAGIRATTITSRGGRFQTRFGSNPGDNTIPKTALKALSLVLRVAWAGWILDGPWNAQAAGASTPTTGNWNTNVAETLLRINWTDDDVVDRQSIIDTPRDTLWHFQDQLDSTVWVQYLMDPVTDPVEGTDWTEYDVSKTATGPGGAPTATSACYVRAMTP